MTECAIEAVALRKSFKGHEALCGLDLTVPRGSVFGFLGRNGAGKTTTIRILMGLTKADQGTARIFGIAPGDDDSGTLLRRRIGFVPEDKELYPYMTVEEIIRFSRPFFPHWREDLERRYLKTFDLPPKKKIPDLSKGMRSKLMMLLAIAGPDAPDAFLGVDDWKQLGSGRVDLGQGRALRIRLVRQRAIFVREIFLLTRNSDLSIDPERIHQLAADR